MFKKYILLNVLPFLFFFTLLLCVLGGSGASSMTPLSPVASEEKMEEYAIVASQLVVPWEIVILTDAVIAEANGKTGIEDLNPLQTTLEFLQLDVKVEHYEIVDWVEAETPTEPDDEATDPLLDESFEEEEGETETEETEPELIPVYDWVEYQTESYLAKKEILTFLELSEDHLNTFTPETFIEKATQFASDKSNDEWRYSVEFKPNTNFQYVLTQILQLDSLTTDKILEFYHSAYLETWLSEETLTRIQQIKAENGLFQFVESDGNYENYEGIVFVDGSTPVVYFSQLDSRWATLPYGTDDIGGYGCGPTSMAIVISTLTGTTYDPVFMANWAYQNGFWAKGSGSYHSLIPESAKAFGLSVTGATASEGQRIVDALSKGKLVVAIMGKGHFTTSGHFMVLRGVTSDGKILIADPASQSKSQQSWELSIILNEARKGAAAGGPFWIIG